MQFIKNVVIAAAGRGTRLGQGMPKCLVEVNGKKIIEYQLEVLKNIPNIRMVVGYHADLVIKTVKEIRDDIIFVMNKDYETTQTLQSYYLGAYGLRESALFLDGDLIPNQSSLFQFMEECSGLKNLIGITPSKSEDAVFVDVRLEHGEKYVYDFSRSVKTPYEWANLAYLSPEILEYKPTYVFEQLMIHTPLRCHEIDCYEIDTPSDLEFVSVKLSNQ